MQYVKYNPIDEYYKSVVGAVEDDTSFIVRLQVNKCIKPSSVTLVFYEVDGTIEKKFAMELQQSNEYDCYITEVKLSKGQYRYYFYMDGVPYEHFIGSDELGNASLFYDNVNSWHLSVYKKKYKTPKWLNKGVMYQIFPDRFCSCGNVKPNEDKVMRVWGEQPYFKEENGVVKNRDFFGGNLKGIISKLPYLKSLNVKTIYLNPIFKAYSNHKYDTEDYFEIDPMFGTQNDFENLVNQAKQNDIKIILDGVFNHVGSDSVYFNRSGKYGKGGAYNDKKSPYRSWFFFHDDGTYDCWWNFDTLPRINAQSKSAQNFFTSKDGVVRHWIKCGASGWRLDVVDELDDCMLDKIVKSAKAQDGQSVIIGEVWEDASNKIDYGKRRHYFDGSQLDSVMNYPLKDAIIEFIRYGNEQILAKTAFTILNNYPAYIRNNLMNILGTHDTCRIITALVGNELQGDDKALMASTKLTDSQYAYGCKLLKLAAVLQYTMFGFPCVFYGDEVGLEGYKDPFCRGCYPWKNQNKELLDFYRRLGQIRENKIFSDGDFRQIVASNGVYAFRRTSKDGEVVVAVNRGHEEYQLELNGNFVDLITGRQYLDTTKVQPDGFVILQKTD